MVGGSNVVRSVYGQNNVCWQVEQPDVEVHDGSKRQVLEQTGAQGAVQGSAFRFQLQLPLP